MKKNIVIAILVILVIGISVIPFPKVQPNCEQEKNAIERIIDTLFSIDREPDSVFLMEIAKHNLP